VKLPAWTLQGLLLLSVPLIAAADTSLHMRLRVVRACALPGADAVAPASCDTDVPHALGDARNPAPAPVRALTPPSPQPQADEADFTTHTF
jgi:hypothetical protein